MQNNKVILDENFLEKNDDIHRKLLRELNRYLNGQLDYLNKQWDFCFDKSNQNYNQEIANFAQEHYNTFIAAMQNGLPVHRFGQLNHNNKSALLNIIKQADKKGMILAQYNNKAYLINTKDEHNKTLSLINPKKIVVTAHPYMNYNDFDNAGSQGKESNTLYLYPLNDKFLSFISSRQTEGVEDTCKIINYFTEKYFEQHKHKQHKQRMNVTLEGGSQGVDFITKMVGSTHGREDTRIKNAEITLNINKPHLFQDEYKIFQRLRNTDNSNNIAKINFGETTHDCLHPKCKTDNLSKCLKYHQKELNNATIEVLQPLGSDQQNAFY